MITTRGLTKQFNGLTAVSDISLQIEEGEIFGLLTEVPGLYDKLSAWKNLARRSSPGGSNDRRGWA